MVMVVGSWDLRSSSLSRFLAGVQAHHVRAAAGAFGLRLREKPWNVFCHSPEQHRQLYACPLLSLYHFEVNVWHGHLLHLTYEASSFPELG